MFCKLTLSNCIHEYSNKLLESFGNLKDTLWTNVNLFQSEAKTTTERRRELDH